MSNRLQYEQSPYLLQHKDNPVDWYPWGEEAFTKAGEDDKPIFLSIGYATCHWCHVMEHESFEDPEVAGLMNDAFVSIKVDREERPDIDQIYMTVCQMVTGQGGWPLTIIMTPDKRPFFAATYIPKQTRMNRLGMLDLIPRIQRAWQKNREEILDAASQLTGALQHIQQQDSAGEEPTVDWQQRAYEQLAQRFDPAYGGFGQAPKFPSPHDLLLLLRYWKRTGNEEALRMVQHTLDHMRRGGLYDHVGFGFHRYSTDRAWKLPHFEKMLYDQAMLVMAYTEAYQATGADRYRRTAEEVLTYVLRDMTDPEGGFYSAEDADSEGREGLFYVWTLEELRDVLEPADAELVIDIYNVERGGNFEEEATRKRTGENILYLSKPLVELAAERSVTEAELSERLERIRRRLFEVRKDRVHPLKDDKILTDWNGLMIAALAQAARVFDEPRYTEAARRAAAFIDRHLRREDGRLWHRYRQGEAGLQANLDDYVFYCWGLLELYETTFDVAYLREAVRLADLMLTHFEDTERGGFFLTPDDGEALITRPKKAFDSATPSGNSVAVLVLIRLARLLARPAWEDKALGAARAFGDAVRQQPSGFCALIMALEFVLGSSYEVVIAGEPDADDTQTMLRRLRSAYVPNKVVVVRPSDEEAGDLLDLAPYLTEQRSRHGAATAYVCQNYQCNQPTTDPETMLSLLDAASG